MSRRVWLPLLLMAAVFFTALPIQPTHSSAVLISDTAMTVMIELSSRHPFCKMHTDRGDIQRMLLQSDPRRIRQVPRESVMELEDVCKKSGSYGYEFRGGLGFIYPGTKWCGPGNVATDYNDLGPHADEDRCCREHDLCPNVLNVGECRRGLCNTGTFTRSHCDCDARLRRCLQAVNSETANTLGAIFYNVVQVTCFQERSPCSAHQRFEHFIYRTSPCDLEFRSAELYIPPNADNLITRIITQSHSIGLPFFPQPPPPSPPPPPIPGYGGRTFHPEFTETSEPPTFQQQFQHFSRRLSVRLASIGLAAVNIVREIVQSPRTIWEGLRASVSREGPMAVVDSGQYTYSPPVRERQEGYFYRNPVTADNFWSR